MVYAALAIKVPEERFIGQYHRSMGQRKANSQTMTIVAATLWPWIEFSCAG
jgi:hypothetical protein